MFPYYKWMGKERYCKDVPIAFPPQHQKQHPGMEYLMSPRPISENPYSNGSKKLQGKTAIITGGDSGIGRAAAYAFAKEGADLAIVYLYEHEDARETKERIEQLGRRCLLICVNLTREDAARDAVGQCLNGFGKIDILVNNHAVQFVQKQIEDITEEQLDLTFRTNIYSYFFMVKAALPHLQPGAAIINTASVTAYNGHPTLLDYSAAKGAIVSFTRSLSLSLLKKGIRVNGVAPGPIWTPLIPSSFSAEEVKTFGTLTPEVPMGRAGQPFEIAASYVFLASDDSSYMSGQILHPNGGDMVSS